MVFVPERLIVPHAVSCLLGIMEKSGIMWLKKVVNVYQNQPKIINRGVLREQDFKTYGS